MGQFDFQGDFPYAAKIGNAADTDVTPWDDVSFLVEEPSRLRLVRRPRRKGNFSLRVECRSGDVDTGTTDRTEMFVNNAGRNLYTEGDKWWFATTIFVPHDSPAITSWFLFHQMHGSESGSPTWAMELTNEQLVFAVRGGNIAVGGDTNWPRNNSYVIHPSVPRGVWLDFLVYTEFSVGSGGVNRVWFREAGNTWPTTPQVDVTGPNLVSIAGAALQLPAPRIGIYRNRRPETDVLYHGGIRVKQTREAAEAMFTDPVSLSDEILADAPVGYWPLSEATGTFADLGSGNRPATAVNAPLRSMPSLTRDKAGAGVNFTPANSYLSVGDLSLGEGAECTMEALVQVRSGSANTVIIGEGRSTSGTPLNELGVFFGSARIAYVNDAATTTTVLGSGLGTRSVSGGKVHHLLMRWSKTLNRAEVFVDGEQQISVPWAPGTITLDNFTIGAQVTGGNPSRRAGDTTVQHVAVYDKYLPDDRVQARWMAATRDSHLLLDSGPTDLEPFATRHKAIAQVAGMGVVRLT